MERGDEERNQGLGGEQHMGSGWFTKWTDSDRV